MLLFQGFYLYFSLEFSKFHILRSCLTYFESILVQSVGCGSIFSLLHEGNSTICYKGCLFCLECFRHLFVKTRWLQCEGLSLPPPFDAITLHICFCSSIKFSFSDPVVLFEVGYYDTSNIVLLMVILTIQNLLHFHVKFEIFFPSSVKLSLEF